MLPIIARDLKPDEVKALLKETFEDGQPEGKDKVHITISGGEQLTLKANVQGKAVRLFIALTKLKNNK